MKKPLFGFLTWIPTTAMAGIIVLMNGISGEESTKLASQMRAESSFNKEVLTNPRPILKNNSLFLEKVETTDPGFFVLFDEKYGNPDSIIGKSEYVESKYVGDIAITVDRELVEGEWIYINYYVDDGNEIFTMNSDAVKLDAFGKQYLKYQVASSGDN